MILRGWMTEAERMALKRWCFQKDVLELGAFEGLSSCCIAMTAKSLVCVDTFDGRGTQHAGESTEEAFWQNLNSIEKQAKVQAIKGTFEKVIPPLDKTFDIIFIDGSHDHESVKQDIQMCLPKLRKGGRLLMHDYGTQNPGVVQAIDEFVSSGAAVSCAQVDSMVMLRRKEDVPDGGEVPIKVVIGMPHRDGWAHYGAVRSAAATPSERYTRWVIDEGNSVLTLTFNTLLARALNLRDQEGATHFAMLHNDVVPLAPYWVDILMDELIARDLDMISAVVPIKNEKGLTSTGSDNIDYPWGVRRLTTTEIMALPETFTINDIAHRDQDACLLLNSGCTLMKINEPWVQGLHFRQQDRITWCLSTKEWVAQGISEDWDFSRQLVARGCRLGATRKLPLFHQLPQYSNEHAWGTEQVDEDWREQHAWTEHSHTHPNGWRL